MTQRLKVLQGDWVERLKELPSGSVHCCVTSPPYWGLRDYGVNGQLGLEKSPEEYVAKLVAGFAEVKRVLRDDGTLWLNLGVAQSYSEAISNIDAHISNRWTNAHWTDGTTSFQKQ